MFFGLLLIAALLGALTYYIAKRMHQGAKYLFSKLSFWIVFVCFEVMTVIMILGFASSQLPVPKGVKHFLTDIGSYWMGAFIYLFLFVLLADMIFLVFRFFRHPVGKNSKIRFISGIAALSLTLTTVIYGVYNASETELLNYDISLSEKSEDRMNIVMISDVHLGAVGSEDRLENIVSKINSVEADLVCIAGDLFDTDFESVRDPEKARKTLKGIKSKYGVYMCPGNHDAGNTAEKMQDFAESCNITVLNDEYTVIDNRLLLVGRLDTSPIGGYLGLERKELSKVMEGAPKELPVVVLDHNPVNVDTYGKEADLVLCGHTHQGQLFPANIITDIIYTVDHGYYRKDDSSPHVIVTSGVGTWGMPMRVGTDSEIIVVDFEF